MAGPTASLRGSGNTIRIEHRMIGATAAAGRSFAFWFDINSFLSG